MPQYSAAIGQDGLVSAAFDRAKAAADCPVIPPPSQMYFWNPDGSVEQRDGQPYSGAWVRWIARPEVGVALVGLDTVVAVIDLLVPRALVGQCDRCTGELTGGWYELRSFRRTAAVNIFALCFDCASWWDGAQLKASRTHYNADLPRHH